MTNQLIYRVAAFSDNGQGGNPAGVWLGDQLPEAKEMQGIANEIAYSETAFACRHSDEWKVRYFSPETEVPFCGHATIALGAVLAENFGNGIYTLQLNHAKISVEGIKEGDKIFSALQSPPTHSQKINPHLLQEALTLFKLTSNDLSQKIPAALIHGGANHLLLALKDRALLHAMQYDLNAGRELMNQYGLVTIMLVYTQTSRLFHSRNAFASGGIYEDPATGAASAAFAGYLRDLDWPHEGEITIIQGEDMGMRSIIHAQISPEIGSSIRVSGSARIITV